VIPALAPRYGGPSAALPALCAALREQGVATTIAATDADGDGRLTVERGVTTTYQGTAAIFFARQFSESFKYSKPLGAWLARNVRAFDVVHVHAVLSHACLSAGRACRHAGVPYVVRPLGTLDPWSLGQKALKKRLLLWAAGRRMLRNAAAIQYTSRQEQAAVEASLGLTRSVVIPLGIDAAEAGETGGVEPPAFSLRVRREPPYVLALSRLHAVKGLETLIEAFGRVASQPAFHEWRLVIAGDGETHYVERLKTLAADGGAAPRIQFAGWVEGADKRALLAGASLFALPSLHESFGISLVEALASGLPVVLSPHVHLADEIGEVGAGWVAGSGLHDYAAALDAAMRSRDERERRGAHARAFARRFAWPRVARQLVDLYRQLTLVGSRLSAPGSSTPEGASPQPEGGREP
jgi:glycosyltransferase involved in cell wall biosynthesis